MNEKQLREGSARILRQAQQKEPAKAPSKWFRRHIIVDHLSKQIRIQVMWDNSGELKITEFQNLKQGIYEPYLWPIRSSQDKEMRKVITTCINEMNYSIVPFFMAGYENEEHALLLFSNIEEPKLTQVLL